MKRSFPINLAGRFFYIDEDAYSMLDNYLSNLTITFGAEDDREIVIDIENRISEILYERIGADSASRPISMPDVEHVIDVIGSPEQVADNDSDFTERSNDENSYSRGNNSETTLPLQDADVCIATPTIRCLQESSADCVCIATGV